MLLRTAATLVLTTLVCSSYFVEVNASISYGLEILILALQWKFFSHVVIFQVCLCVWNAFKMLIMRVMISIVFFLRQAGRVIVVTLKFFGNLGKSSLKVIIVRTLYTG